MPDGAATAGPMGTEQIVQELMFRLGVDPESLQQVKGKLQDVEGSIKKTGESAGAWTKNLDLAKGHLFKIAGMLGIGIGTYTIASDLLSAYENAKQLERQFVTMQFTLAKGIFPKESLKDQETFATRMLEIRDDFRVTGDQIRQIMNGVIGTGITEVLSEVERLTKDILALSMAGMDTTGITKVINAYREMGRGVKELRGDLGGMIGELRGLNMPLQESSGLVLESVANYQRYKLSVGNAKEMVIGLAKAVDELAKSSNVSMRDVAPLMQTILNLEDMGSIQLQKMFAVAGYTPQRFQNLDVFESRKEWRNMFRENTGEAAQTVVGLLQAMRRRDIPIEAVENMGIFGGLLKQRPIQEALTGKEELGDRFFDVVENAIIKMQKEPDGPGKQGARDLISDGNKKLDNLIVEVQKQIKATSGVGENVKMGLDKLYLAFIGKYRPPELAERGEILQGSMQEIAQRIIQYTRVPPEGATAAQIETARSMYEEAMKKAGSPMYEAIREAEAQAKMMEGIDYDFLAKNTISPENLKSSLEAQKLDEEKIGEATANALANAIDKMPAKIINMNLIVDPTKTNELIVDTATAVINKKSATEE